MTAIMGDSIKEASLVKTDIDKLITLCTIPWSHLKNNSIRIVSFSKVRIAVECASKDLDIILLKAPAVSFVTLIKSCRIYAGTCRHYKRTYGPLSKLDTLGNKRIVINTIN